MSVATTWGTTAEERGLAFPGDDLLEEPRQELFRGISVHADAGTIFRWLCQLRVAPYSYDLIDNLGRRSPRELTPGLDDLEIGQRFMIFSLVSFEQDSHITMRLGSTETIFRHFVEDMVVTYLIVPGGNTQRLLMKLTGRYTSGPLGWAASVALSWGDLIMARKQLMTLRDLAEGAST